MIVNSENGARDVKASGISPPVPDFDVSWAGVSPWGPSYCFGSEDGRFCLTSPQRPEVILPWGGPYDISPSREPISGIAFATDLMAASTRRDVTFRDVPQPNGREGHSHRATFPGGAFGVIATAGGRVLAPMGRRGILSAGPKEGTFLSVDILGPGEGDPVDAYWLASVDARDGREALVCAARRDGLLILPLHESQRAAVGRRLKSPGVDFIDVAPLGMPDAPLAIAALGMGCSIHFARDVLGDRGVKTIHRQVHGERGYRILCAEGHVFVLTSRNLLIFPNLARCFLDGDPLTGFREFRASRLEAVDMSLAPDRSLLIVMPDCVYRVEIDSLVQGASRHSSWPKDTNREAVETPFEESAWSRTEEVSLVLA
jgi:hypothetical protein